MSRAWTRVVATTFGLALGMGFAGCDGCRPGLDPIAADEANLVQIEPGWFVFGGQSECNAPDDPADHLCDPWEETRRDRFSFPWRLAYLTGYRIEQREVTNREYLECVQSHDSSGDPICGRPDDCGNVPILAEMAASFVPAACPMAHEDVALEPVRNVSWLDARRYCKWRYGQISDELGARADLPTEAQWERAAVGLATDGQPFAQPDLPTTVTPNADLGCADLVVSVSGSCVSDGNNTENEAYNSEPHPFTVMNADGELYRTQFASPAGLIDMMGNVSEWTLDAVETGRASPCSDAYLGADFAVTDDCFGVDEDGWCTGSREANVAGLLQPMWCNPVVGVQDLDLDGTETSFERVVKGGNYNTKDWCEVTPRVRQFELEPDDQVGFRCVVWDQKPGKNFHSMCPEPIGADAPPTATGLPDAGAPDSAELDAGDEDI